MRVILSMTTIPSRVGKLDQTIESLLAQAFKPDEIRLHLTPATGIPRESALAWGAHVTAVPVEQDYGPVTKLYAVTDKQLDPSDLVVTVDDDIVYKPEWLAMVVGAAQTFTDDAIGFAGWDVKRFLDGSGVYIFKSAPSFCDVLEGWAGAAYRVRFFDGVDIMRPPPAFHFVDDVWISSQLHKRGIKRRLIAFPQAKAIEGNGPGLHTRHDFVELNRQAAILGFEP